MEWFVYEVAEQKVDNNYQASVQFSCYVPTYNAQGFCYNQPLQTKSEGRDFPADKEWCPYSSVV